MIYERRRIVSEGVVQGIGFRPFVYRLATELSLTGFVRNSGNGIEMELQGAPHQLNRFETRLRTELPEGGRLVNHASQSIPPDGAEQAFAILESTPTTAPVVTLVPDRYVCDACLREMADPSDRRFEYPFINCTHCGPRYTITRALPYDRPTTTMAGFTLCEACRAEYANPTDRRYHAEPVACPTCGPTAWLALPGADPEINAPAPSDPSGSALAVKQAARYLKDGRIVAVKGIGGFHLAVDAASKTAVMRLRALKHRTRKPFALMARDLALAGTLIEMDDDTASLLASPAAPIVLQKRKSGKDLSEWVAPGLDDLGVMLPYTPLHHLLLRNGPPVLVMTSGNPPAEPITTDNREAREKLGADVYLMHDRPIAVANDDSVIRAAPFGPVFIRRSRGYVPEALDVSHLPERSVLALGALLKVTLATLHRGQLAVGRHLGDLDNERAEDAFAEALERMLAFGRFTPEIVAVDLHPDLPSRQLAAARFADIPICPVQHHHAHLAAVMAEHGLASDATAIGIILDGVGFGADGTLWGGEVLEGGYAGFDRRVHLRAVPQPGGDKAAREPGRMATSLLLDADCGDLAHPAFDDAVAGICRLRQVSPLTTSAGRLFDGVAALLKIAPKTQDFEGEAAGRLEAAAATDVSDAYPLPRDGGALDTRALVRALLDDPSPSGVRAARFINGLADGLADATRTLASARVVLGGGCMVNRLLVRRLIDRLRNHGKTVLTAKQLPPGDGGLSAGQAVIAAHMPREGM